MLTPKRVALKKSKRKSLDIDFSIPQLNPNIAFTRSTTATVLAYAPTAVAGDLPLVTTCAINEARFQNARRVSQGVWSNTLNDGSDISLPISLLHEEARSNLCLQSEVFKTTWVDALATGLSPNSITISPDGNFAYVTNANSSTASQYSRDAATGLLSALSPATIATGTTPWSIAISPDGNFAYVTNSSANTASQYSRNAATGLLSALSPATIATGATPYSITISPDGNFAYVTNSSANTASQYSRDAATGLLSALSPATIATGTTPWSIAISPDGNFAYVTNGGSSTASQYSRNAATGLLSALSPATIATGTTPRIIAISPDGKFAYVTNGGANTASQYSRNAATGLLSALSPATIATGTTPRIITISPDGNFAYVTNANSSTASQYSRDAATGLLSALSPATIATGTTPWSITISPDGNFAYVTNANSSTASQYSRNAATGLLTLNNPIVITDNSTTAPDGATTADTLTAAAANSTLLQTITSAIAPRAFSIWLKRLTGTGNIDLTVDGGTTWTTVAVTSTWTRFILTRENVTNPGVGIRIVTKDDAVYAWGAQLESKNNASSYIPTTTAAITKTTDSALFTGTNLSSWYNTLQGTFIVTANGQEFVAPYNMGVTALTYASQTKYGLSYDNDNKMGSTYLYTAGTVVAPTEYTSIAVPSSLYIAGGGLTNVTRFTYYQTKLKTAQMELLL